MNLRDKAEALRALHVPGKPLVLINAWDAASAVIIVKAGAAAVATTSAGAANALGYPDGQRVTREQMLSMVAPIVRAVDVPVTADMEAGYGDEPEAAAATARGLVEVGAVGLNVEDTADAGDDPLLSIDAFVAKIRAIRTTGEETGVPLVLNARTDVFIGAVGEPGTRLEHAIERGRAYIEAGADCVFVPAVVAAGQIEALVQGIGGPVSVLAGPTSPPLGELARLGVARVSVGSGAYRAALALGRRLAEEAYRENRLDTVFAAQVSFDETQTLFDR